MFKFIINHNHMYAQCQNTGPVCWLIQTFHRYQEYLQYDIQDSLISSSLQRKIILLNRTLEVQKNDEDKIVG